MAVTAVASFVDNRGIFLSNAIFSTKINPNWPEITPKYPEVGANGTRTYSMLTDQAVLLYNCTYEHYTHDTIHTFEVY